MGDKPSVVVIGGGSTGTGVVRDLALRGFDATLLEKGDLTNGTTGRMHGLLHSGARYAVSDEESAGECIEENRVLKEIAGHTIEDTGGVFAKLPGDSDEYFEEKKKACRDIGISAVEVGGDEARGIEPYLSQEVEKGLVVPDAAIDPFRLCVANAKDAENHGARIETHCEVTDLILDDGYVTGVKARYLPRPGRENTGETRVFEADHVVNASGPWAASIAGMAGINVEVRPSKGAMVVMNVRQVDTVVNRCRSKGDADIIVPHETTAILGTTDVEVGDPEGYTEEKWEVEHLIDELSELVPILGNARTIRSFWGVRPLYEARNTEIDDPTDITRTHSVIDHEEIHGIGGFTTIVGGKTTTHRLMAEDVCDHVAAKFGISAECVTHREALPGSRDISKLDDAMREYGLTSPVRRRSQERLGDRADEVLGNGELNPVLCECEAVTRSEVRDSVDDCGVDLNAVRIRTRASMGSCQGAFCCHRLANELVSIVSGEVAMEALLELVEERWKGERHALWGEHLSQAALKHRLYTETMNLDRYPHSVPSYAEYDHGEQDE